MILALWLACRPEPVAEGIFGQLGDPLPRATPEQLATFVAGQDVARRRFDRASGLGPAFNVTFCGACHEKPTLGGGAGLYRNFTIAATVDADGAYFPAASAGNKSGVQRIYDYADGEPARPAVLDTANVFAQRNPIPFFGIGLLAALSEDEILSRADPDDKDHDGISGRPNYDRGYVGRFGMKAQTVSIEGFIRGPLFNHGGISSDPLTDEMRARLPVDSSGGGEISALEVADFAKFAQAAAPDAPLTDDDGVPDPELAPEDLFALVSMAMLTAAPEPESLYAASARGEKRFADVGCDDCHAPRLRGPDGAIPAYSDLLLHDMGPDLADGVRMGEATASEFRTQPLWGIAAEGPFLHDGRAGTIDAAIRLHGGEGQASADAYADLDEQGRFELLAFLDALGGRDQASPGLLPPDASIPVAGAFGAPVAEADAARFTAARAAFDREYSFAEGIGSPRYNGDSCRACHFEPVIGGSGPRDVNVMRHGIVGPDGVFVPPASGTILHRVTARLGEPLRAQPEATIFEHRQTPPLFGLGLVEAIPEAAILANADPNDVDHDGISGKPSTTDGGRLGRFGWKAQVPTLEEFARDAFAAELGMTMPYVEGLTFGRLQDNDAVPDPEVDLDALAAVTDFLRLLGPPPPGDADPDAAARGEAQFAEVGCDACHVPALGGVPLYSDLLLHDVLPAGALGIEDASAEMGELRTAPLWGIGASAPYLHDGRADTLEQAIEGHDGEAAASRDAFLALDPAAQSDLVTFLGSL